MIQAAFFVQVKKKKKKKKKSWNSSRIPGLVDVENSPPRAPYVEDEIWGSSPRTKLKEGMSSEINFTKFPKEPSTAKSTLLHKGAIEYIFRIPKRSALSHKSINDSDLVCQNARSVPWAGKEALAPIGEQDSIGHDIGSRTSKSSSLSEEPGSRILRAYCGAKGSRDSSLFHIKPKVHAEEEEMHEDEQRESRLPGYAAEDDPVLGRPKSRKGKAPRHQR